MNRNQRRLAKKQQDTEKRRALPTLQRLFDEAVRHHQAARLADAERLYRQILSVDPHHADSLHSLGLVGHQLGHRDGAIELIGQAIRLRDDVPSYHNNLGLILQAAGKLDAAAECYRRALALDPQLAATNYNLGLIYKAQGNFEAAADCYERALALAPDDTQAQINLGDALQAQGKLDAAIAWYERALQRAPDDVVGHINLGNAFHAQGRLDAALGCYERACALKPDDDVALKNRAGVLKSLGRLDESFAVCRRVAELRAREPARREPQPVWPHKLKHDREQLDYLIGTYPAADTFRVAAESLAQQPARAAEIFAGLFHLEPGARLAEPALAATIDVAAVQATWDATHPNVVVIDNLLTPEALDALRRFCWGSTVWQAGYAGGYLGAFLNDGFACPLLAQIAAELAVKLPGIIRNHPVMTVWGFHYDSALEGTSLHADEAAVNVNFWITPDDANLDPDGGGLVIWDVPAPLDWDYEKYQKDPPAIRAFLAEQKAKSITVPYRCNRAVVFDSDLFHETDRLSFREGYLNRRINVTMLYGWRHDE